MGEGWGEGYSLSPFYTASISDMLISSTRRVGTLRFTAPEVMKHLDGVPTRIRDVSAQRIEAGKKQEQM